MFHELYNNNWFRVVAVIAVVAITVTVARTDDAERSEGGLPEGTAPLPSLDDFTVNSVSIDVPRPMGTAKVEASNPVVPVDKKPGFWVGVKCTPASDALRDQLNIPKQRGLLVVEVVDGSPADKAKLRRHDVLLKLGDVELATIDDLGRAIEVSKGKEMSVQLIRRAKAVRTNVSPIRRPEKYSENSTENLAKIDADRRKEFLTRFLQDQTPESTTRNFRMRFYGPGVVIADSDQKRSFQGNLNIEITRTKDEQVKVVLSHGGQVLKTVEADVQELPAELLDVLRRSLGWYFDQSAGFDFKIGGTRFGPGSEGIVVNAGGGGHALVIPLRKTEESADGWLFNVDGPHTTESSGTWRDKQIESLLKQVEDLKRSVDRLNSKEKTEKQ